MARRLGTSEKELEALERGDVGDFEPSWRAALEFAESITPTRGRPKEETYSRVAEHWTAAQIVEITAVITLFNYFNRFATALRIPPTV
ncbi:MAG: carboxymuconolactone decarboxylase family protein [Gemmatimonadaceae bacterium]